MSSMRATRNALASALRVAQSISSSHFNYELPPHRIAQRPADLREGSKLLAFNKTTGKILHKTFKDIPQLIPQDSLLVLNETQVVSARVMLKKEKTGGKCEAMLIRPLDLSPAESILAQAENEHVSQWSCLFRGRNVETGALLVPETPMRLKNEEKVRVVAKMIKTGKSGSPAVLEFTWKAKVASRKVSFHDVLNHIGSVPLPPYMSRPPNRKDHKRYQTVYSKVPGSVAAPTAGLHFTNELLKKIEEQCRTKVARVTLHVGAGTFLPIQADRMKDHVMHEEQIHVTADVLEQILHQKSQGRPVIAVGTTSVRTLETMYWVALQVMLQYGQLKSSLESRVEMNMLLSQWTPYEIIDQVYGGDSSRLPSVPEAFTEFLQFMRKSDIGAIMGFTQLLIAPSYPFRVVDSMVTNFHQPRSTLLMLVAAFVDENPSFSLDTVSGLYEHDHFPNLRSIYSEALACDYRFLSYGDSSILAPGHFFPAEESP